MAKKQKNNKQLGGGGGGGPHATALPAGTNPHHQPPQPQAQPGESGQDKNDNCRRPSEAEPKKRRASSLAQVTATTTPAATTKQKAAKLLDRIQAFCLYKLLLPFLLGLVLALYCKHSLQSSGGDQSARPGASLGDQQRRHDRPLARPEPLMSYVHFNGRYPRKHYGRPPSYSERAHRSLLFNMDLISTASHNVAYLLRRTTYSVRQSPFKSDRTLEEQADFLGQLDQFNLTQIMSNSENRRRLRLRRQRHRQDHDDVGDDHLVDDDYNDAHPMPKANPSLESTSFL